MAKKLNGPVNVANIIRTVDTYGRVQGSAMSTGSGQTMLSNVKKILKTSNFCYF